MWFLKLHVPLPKIPLLEAALCKCWFSRWLKLVVRLFETVAKDQISVFASTRSSHSDHITEHPDLPSSLVSTSMLRQLRHRGHQPLPRPRCFGSGMEAAFHGAAARGRGAWPERTRKGCNGLPRIALVVHESTTIIAKCIEYIEWFASSWTYSHQRKFKGLCG